METKNARILKYLHGYDFVYVYICLCVCAVNNMCHSNLFIQANLSPYIYKLMLIYIYAFVYMYCYNISVIVLLCIWSGFSLNSLLLYTYMLFSLHLYVLSFIVFFGDLGQFTYRSLYWMYWYVCKCSNVLLSHVS